MGLDMKEIENSEYLEQKERLIKELEIGLNSEMVVDFDPEEFLKSLHNKYLTEKKV